MRLEWLFAEPAQVLLAGWVGEVSPPREGPWRNAVDAQQIESVRSDWALVERDPDRFVAGFYERLFGIDPAARRLFSDDMSQQRRKLAIALRFVVNQLDRPDQLRSVLVGLGQRHASYGVKPEHFDSVGRALVETLDEELGAGFDERHREAWQEAYAQVSAAMIDAMERYRGHTPPSEEPGAHRSGMAAALARFLGRA